MAFSWEDHYRSGGTSGDPADYARTRSWKMDLIRKHVNLLKDSILDVGCGDMQFWDGLIPPFYFGTDISTEIIKKNRERYPGTYFFRADASVPFLFPADVVLCFDVLWHIIDDDEYTRILQNIKNNAGKTIMIFTWSSDPSTILSRLIDIKKGGYQKYRDFKSNGIPLFEPEFKLIETVQNPEFKCGSMYVFRRIHP